MTVSTSDGQDSSNAHLCKLISVLNEDGYKSAVERSVTNQKHLWVPFNTARLTIRCLGPRSSIT